jgi:hypothetical protein
MPPPGGGCEWDLKFWMDQNTKWSDEFSDFCRSPITQTEWREPM